MTAKKITDKDRCEWLMRGLTEIYWLPRVGEEEGWGSYSGEAGGFSRPTKRAAIDATIRAERKRRKEKP